MQWTYFFCSIPHLSSRACKQISLRYCCSRFAYKDSMNITLKFLFKFIRKKSNKKKNKTVKLWRIFGVKYMKRTEWFLHPIQPFGYWLNQTNRRDDIINLYLLPPSVYGFSSSSFLNFQPFLYLLTFSESFPKRV